MVLKRLLAAVGIGGPSIDTVIPRPHVRPGEQVQGHIDLEGGEVESRIERIDLALRARVEYERGDSEGSRQVLFHQMAVADGFVLAPGERRRVPFAYPLTLQAPLTSVGGHRLPGAGLGLSTDVSIGGAVDKGDLDPLEVHPLPAQERVLEALARLGFRLAKTDIEEGRLAGTRQEFPFFQEIEYRASPRFADRMRELEVSFVADAQGTEVVLEADKRGGLLTESQDRYARFRVPHHHDGTDLAPVLAQQIDRMVRRRGGLMGDLFG
ncbi:sporulation protein [Nocardiopsis composta]|uniref:Sporulation-control protein n=1 Tax=Nocardiopsis composta TaxID=157465 RepID=A0A7W8QN27_9ACTN|nr:sporulation protein [Nocardiopsis composta]MBB5433462.1 sporulation-control protein [Nocardiopsis composta]